MGGGHIPKVIENLRESVIQAAREQLREAGYRRLALRSVARACGIAVGTIYNYFPSKDALVAGVMAKDWERALAAMREGCGRAAGLAEGFSLVCGGIADFAGLYSGIWAEYAFAGSVKYSFPERHQLLCVQLGQIIRPLLARFGREADDGICVFLAEALLSAALRGDGFATLAGVVDALFITRKGYRYEQLQEPKDGR